MSRLDRGDPIGVVLVMIDNGGPIVERFLHRLDKEPKREVKPEVTLCRGPSRDLCRLE